MSEPFDAMADALDADTAMESDPAYVTDEDNLDADPLEDGMDTPDDYSRALKFGEEPETLAYRIPQEEPDPALEEIEQDPGRPLAATPVDDLDSSVDEPDPESSVAVEPEWGEVELGLDSAVGSNEPTGLPADDGIGTATPVENEYPTEGAEQEALRIEQER